MRYDDFTNHYGYINKNETRAQFKERLSQQGRRLPFNSTSAYINERINFVNDNQAPLNINEIPDEQIAERRALTMELRQKMMDRYVDRQASPMPADRKNYRYVHDLMLKTGDQAEIGEYNENYYNKFAANDETRDRKFVISEHYKLLKGLEDAKPEELLSKELTDRELVDNFEKIHSANAITLQFENMRKNFPELTTLPEGADEETVQQFNEIQRMMDKYNFLGHGFAALALKLGCIEDDVYSAVDINDPVTHKIAADITAFKYGAGNEACQIFFGDMVSVDQSFFTGEFDACEKIFKDSGVKTEDLVYNLYDRDGNIIEGNKKFDKDSAKADISQHPRYSVMVFDKNDPENSLTVYGDAKPRLMNSLIADEASLKKAADDLKPGFFKSFIHNYISKSFFKDDFDKYEKAKSAYDAKTMKARVDAKKNPPAEQKAEQKEEQKNSKSLEEAQAAKERIKEAQITKINQNLQQMPHRTQQDLDFHNKITSIAHTDGLDKTRELLAKCKPQEYDTLYGMFKEGKNLDVELPKLAGEKPVVEVPVATEKATAKVADKGDKVVEGNTQPQFH